MASDLSNLSHEDAAFFREKGYLQQKPEVEAWVRDYAKKLVQELAPHQAFIEKRFQEENTRFTSLFARDHDAIGRVLKHHLILESYMTRHLEAVSPTHAWRDARLGFARKVELLPKENQQIQFLLPGIREVNAIRNMFSHEIDATPSLDSVKQCLRVLEISHPYFNKTYTHAIDVVEDFTATACLWLSVDKEVELIFKEAHSRVKPLPAPI
jgi:hypothetical protein